MLPPLVIAIGFLALVGVYVAKQLGIVKKDTPVKTDNVQIAELSSGSVSESKWILNITRIVREENERLRNEIMLHLKENFEETHKARNSILALQGLVSESERNVLQAIEDTQSIGAKS